MKRGVVAAPAVISRAPRGFTVERTLSAEESRFYLLYWDHIAIPANNLVYIGVADEQEQIASGAIDPSFVITHRIPLADALRPTKHSAIKRTGASRWC